MPIQIVTAIIINRHAKRKEKWRKTTSFRQRGRRAGVAGETRRRKRGRERGGIRSEKVAKTNVYSYKLTQWCGETKRGGISLQRWFCVGRFRARRSLLCRDWTGLFLRFPCHRLLVVSPNGPVADSRATKEKSSGAVDAGSASPPADPIGAIELAEVFGGGGRFWGVARGRRGSGEFCRGATWGTARRAAGCRGVRRGRGRR